MGSFEKLVVLTVLFLVVLVLGVTLNSGEADGAGAPGPLHSALLRSESDVDTGAEPGSFVGETERGGASETLGLLSSSVSDAEAERASGPDDEPVSEARDARGRALATGLIVDGTGLEVNPALSDFRIYEVQPNDTWTSLSERFYGTRSYATLLRQSNDDPAALRAGQSILVPVRDFSAEGGSREPHEPAPRTARAGDAGPAAGRASASVDTYTIAAGDSLSVISLKVYGTSRRWGEIYEANRDVLSDPDTLEVGVELRIP